MSCCGCASRVLKLQSEMRSWKTRLGDEKREKKMILRWIQAVFGYDVKVEIEKETRVVRLQATENKEAMSKAIIKSVIGSEEDCGVMLMEVKLEDNEYYEPFEDTFELPELAILEINRLNTTPQLPLLSAGISAIGNSHLQHSPQTLSITTPMEVAPAQISIPNQGQQVVYIAGGLDDGTTLQAPPGQSYLIVRSNEPEEVLMPMEYSTVVSDNIIDGSNFIIRAPAPIPETVNINTLANLNMTIAANPLPVQIPTLQLPLQPIIKTEVVASLPHPAIPVQIPVELKQCVPALQPQLAKPSTKKTKKSSLSTASRTNTKSSSKAKSALSVEGEMDIKIKNVSSQFLANSSVPTSLVRQPDKSSMKQAESAYQPTKSESVFGLTLREKAEVFVLQKARDAVEQVTNGFQCSLCEETRYTYSTLEMAISHTKTHFESKPYKCENCDDLFANQRELSAHRKSKHSKPKATAGLSPKFTQSKISKSSASTKSIPKTKTTSNPIQISFSGLTNSTSSVYNNSSARTIRVEAPFDKI